MSPINYREAGSGPSVMLLHGFPMNLHVWESVVEKLSDEFHVITPDLPGFGRSAALAEGFTIDDVASSILQFMKERNFVRPVVIGHSLGGYVTLAMAEQQPDALAGFCLFHSTALPDSEEKKQSRNKVLDFIEKQGVHAFTSNFIAGLYADPQHSSIMKVKNIAVSASAETVIGYTKAMRDRKDRTHVVKAFPRPMLLLGGEKDQAIPAESILQQASLSPQAEAIILPGVAHMGMFEAEPVTVKKISAFVKKCEVTF
ncbi:MAG TPA: alpha/beta hydrolase [Chryseosolibacter sp.]|nr:alpha/beta hydrolase [Chryseosolibacter sp.]